MENRFYIQEIRPGVYLIDEAHQATGYLVVGSERACVIDTMNGLCDLRAAVRELTDKPLTVVNTHGHPDHVFGNVYFDGEVDKILIEPRDRELAEMFMAQNEQLAAYCREKGAKVPPFGDIREGDVIDLGGRTLEVFGLPGHTAGSIMLLLKEERILFSGDAVNHHLWVMFDDTPPLEDILSALDRVMFLEEKADIILHGHAHDTDDISLMRCLRKGVSDIIGGRTENDSPYQWFGGTAKQHPFAGEEGKHYQQDDHVICYR